MGCTFEQRACWYGERIAGDYPKKKPIIGALSIADEKENEKSGGWVIVEIFWMARYAVGCGF